MLIIELLVYATCLFFFFSILLICPGEVLLSKYCRELPKELRVACSFGISSLCYYYILSSFLWVGASPGMIAGMLWSVVAVSVVVWCWKKQYTGYRHSTVSIGLSLFLGYYLFSLVGAAFPNGDYRNTSPEIIVKFGSGKQLPIDNIVSYNVSRYVIEGRDPQKLEVVPTWSISDRGPLAGLMNATSFLLLGLRETKPWLSVSSEIYFVYQALLTYLNLLVLFSLWLVANILLGRKYAACAVALVVSSAFFYQNIIYTWPKFYAAYFSMLALILWTKYGLRALTGLFFGGGVLAHPLGGLYCLSFLFYQAIRTLRDFVTKRAGTIKALLQDGLKLAIGFLIAILPWAIFKLIYVSPSSRLLYLNLFCNYNQNLEGVTFYEALQQYLSENTFGEILRIRFFNFIYPFDISYLLNKWHRPWSMIRQMSQLSFYQFMPAIGIFPLLIAFFVAYRQKLPQPFREIFITAWGGLILSVIVFGCGWGTSNHCWAYLPFIITPLVASIWFMNSSVIGIFLFVVTLFINSLISYSYFFYENKNRVIAYGSSWYQGTEVFLFLVMMGAMMSLIFFELRSGGGRQSRGEEK